MSSLKEYKADLHIHTCLSPCGSLDMTPLKIVEKSLTEGLSIIAITDHNSAENIDAVLKASAGSGLTVIPGMEITTMEEVHILALFMTPDHAKEMQGLIFDALPAGKNNEELFGLQVVANEHDEVEYINERLLIRATGLHINTVVEKIHQLEGLAIAAHIDREMFSIISQLGFVPRDLTLDGIEISKNTGIRTAMETFSQYSHIPFLSSSDSHTIDMIGSTYNLFRLKETGFNEIKLALRSSQGRKIIYS